MNRSIDDRIIELLYRNLQEVFGEGDAARRHVAIQDFYTEDCVLYVPPGVFVGHNALDKFAGDLRATHPHFVYTPHGEPQALHNGGILAWGSGPKGEAPDYTGLDVVIVRDGKILGLHLGSGIVSAIINATIGALLLLLVIKLVRGGGGWHRIWGGNWGRRCSVGRQDG
jgi:hypothetical protein